jgi:hypothetical protein
LAAIREVVQMPRPGNCGCASRTTAVGDRKKSH